ncbi:hypothetical protein GN316_06775 [Xylophilus sp. Kf1]|nr:hypothetical protein [Xylophilus sp. Kf1]
MDTIQSECLCSIFYASRATCSLTQIERIVATSRRNNRARGITGGMLFTGRYFAQILEGPREIVMKTMLVMADDERHDLITPIWDRSVFERTYPKWTMGFITIPSADHIIDPLLHSAVTGGKAANLGEMLAKLIQRADNENDGHQIGCTN